MEYLDFVFQAKDGKNLQGYKWIAEKQKKTKAIIQISHGMSEYAQNYHDFVQPLIRSGYIVYAHDHRGHGKSAKCLEEIGYFADNNGWDLAVSDMHQLTEVIRREWPGKPIYVFGYSLGSLLVRDYIALFPNSTDGAILCGTHGGMGWLCPIGLGVLKWMIGRKGSKIISPFLNKLSFGSNQGILPLPRIQQRPALPTKVSSLSSLNPIFYRQYYKIGFYYDLLYGLQKVCSTRVVNRTPKDLPIYLFSGEQDPVGNNTKGVLKVYHSYKNAGIKDVQYKFYRNTGHEIYTMNNKAQVFEDLLHWLENHTTLRSEKDGN